MKFINYLIHHTSIAILASAGGSLLYLVINGQPAGESRFFTSLLILIPGSMLISRIQKD